MSSSYYPKSDHERFLSASHVLGTALRDGIPGEVQEPASEFGSVHQPFVAMGEEAVAADSAVELAESGVRQAIAVVGREVRRLADALADPVSGAHNEEAIDEVLQPAGSVTKLLRTPRASLPTAVRQVALRARARGIEDALATALDEAANALDAALLALDAAQADRADAGSALQAARIAWDEAFRRLVLRLRLAVGKAELGKYLLRHSRSSKTSGAEDPPTGEADAVPAAGAAPADAAPADPDPEKEPDDQAA